MLSTSRELRHSADDLTYVRGRANRDPGDASVLAEAVRLNPAHHRPVAMTGHRRACEISTRNHQSPIRPPGSGNQHAALNVAGRLQPREGSAVEGGLARHDIPPVESRLLVTYERSSLCVLDMAASLSLPLAC